LKKKNEDEKRVRLQRKLEKVRGGEREENGEREGERERERERVESSI
jgi:hypothetical protein